MTRDREATINRIADLAAPTGELPVTFGQMTGSEMVCAWVLLSLIVAEEASAITIISPNADFNGQPDYAVEVCASWTGYHRKRYTGDTIIQALDAANRDRR